MNKHYIFWETLPIPNWRDYSGLKVIETCSAEDACFYVGSVMSRSLKRAVKVVYQKTEVKL